MQQFAAITYQMHKAVILHDLDFEYTNYKMNDIDLEDIP